MKLALHHVSVIAWDLERAAAFYEGVLGFTRIPRPPFKTAGPLVIRPARFSLHVVIFPEGSFRSSGVHTDDVHFALHTGDFEAALATLEAKHGFNA